ncbi:Pentatricopeptide repeat-containing protein [Melia azedarach]|uniref:Pentatricopeptide repeat-containing protein n=1 Tax=Melia azedarach TaxID=155640 RepID=A0ACC1XFA9_MELAZ|nr:Pentatricopeptide repeat-containing protein [Melia azedarach]
MEFSDMRFFFTPLINTVLLLLNSEGGTISLLPACTQYFNDRYPTFKFASFVVKVLVSLLFLVTPIQLHLGAYPKITMKIGYFSYPLTFSLIASILCSPPRFWLVHALVLITIPIHEKLWNLQKLVFIWFLLTLRSIPTFEISCTLNHQEDMTAEATPPPPSSSTSSRGFEVESAVIEIKGNVSTPGATSPPSTSSPGFKVESAVIEMEGNVSTPGATPTHATSSSGFEVESFFN